MNFKENKTSLFLIELIIVVLFFSLCSAICVKLFAHADIMSDRSRIINACALQAQNIAQCIKNDDGGYETLKENYPVSSDYETVIYFDNDLNPVDKKQDSLYLAKIVSLKTDINGLKTSKITFERNDEEIFSLDVSSYSAGKADDDE